jgi:hypothetical protein
LIGPNIQIFCILVLFHLEGTYMSKKAKKSPAGRKPEHTQSKVVAARAASRSGPARRQSGRVEDVIDQRAVSITMAVLGVIALVGAVAMVIRLNGVYSTEAIITIVLLAFVAGLSAFAVVRTADFINFFARITR